MFGVWLAVGGLRGAGFLPEVRPFVREMAGLRGAECRIVTVETALTLAFGDFMAELVEPTEDERRNGWTTETLTIYLAERERAQSEAFFNPPKRRPRRANSRYSPFRWRK